MQKACSLPYIRNTVFEDVQHKLATTASYTDTVRANRGCTIPEGIMKVASLLLGGNQDHRTTSMRSCRPGRSNVGLGLSSRQVKVELQGERQQNARAVGISAHISR